MNDFTFYNPVRIVFGRASIEQLGSLVPAGKRVMMTYGGGSIKKNGVYDRAIAALKDFDVVEFGGIEPNPKYEKLMEGVELARREKVDFLLAVGGGSVLDGTKFIAAAVPDDGGDPWELARGDRPVSAALPLADVLTLPATGSEMNCIGVISRESTVEKYGFRSELLFPQFSVLDPTVTMTLPERQLRNGIADTFIHVIEQYLTTERHAPLQDRQAEAVLLTVLEQVPLVEDAPKNYDVRANLMWCATQALNGLLGCGVPVCFGTHRIGHELTAHWGIDHAQTLAVVLPALLRHLKDAKRIQLMKYARRVWHITGDDADEVIEKGIVKTEAFFKDLGFSLSLEDLGATKDTLAQIAKTLGERDKRISGCHDLGEKDVRAIFDGAW